jgi:mediator of RNA polymerase II transcription subunit 14
LGFYLPLSREEQQLQQAQGQGIEAPGRRQLPEGVVDTPLVRLFNFLRESSCFYLSRVFVFVFAIWGNEDAHWVDI